MGSVPTPIESEAPAAAGKRRISAALARATGRRGLQRGGLEPAETHNLGSGSSTLPTAITSPGLAPRSDHLTGSGRMVFRRTLSLLSRRRVAPGAGILAAATLGLAPLTGCAVGVTPTGKSVVGLEVGEGATTLQRAGEFATGIAPILPPPMGEIAAAAGLVLAGGAGEIARRRSKAAAEAEAERRRLEGREEGWDQREAAAAPKPAAAPLPTGGAPA